MLTEWRGWAVRHNTRLTSLYNPPVPTYWVTRILKSWTAVRMSPPSAAISTILSFHEFSYPPSWQSTGVQPCPLHSETCTSPHILSRNFAAEMKKSFKSSRFLPMLFFPPAWGKSKIIVDEILAPFGVLYFLLDMCHQSRTKWGHPW